MEILFWLVPAGGVAGLAMAWAAWAGRPRRDEQVDRSDAAKQRFAAAMERPHPGAARPRPVRVHDRSTGIAVRPSRAGRAAGGAAPGDA